MNRFCKQCGSMNTSPLLFCWQCGASLTPQRQLNTYDQHQNKQTNQNMG